MNVQFNSHPFCKMKHKTKICQITGKSFPFSTSAKYFIFLTLFPHPMAFSNQIHFQIHQI